MIDRTPSRSAGTLYAAIAVFLVLLTTAGCGGDDGTGGLSGPLTYSRGGGIAGRMDRLVVRPDGTARITTRRGGERTIELTPRRLADLERDLRDADFGDAPTESQSDPPIPDTFGHRVVYEGRTVSADDGAMPKRLGDLMYGLGGLVDSYDAP